MGARRLRSAVTIGAVALTVGVAAAVAADPLPRGTADPPPPPAPSSVGDPAGDLAAREARALARLRAAELLLRAEAVRQPAPAPASAPVVAVAPAPTAPVTSSGSS